MQVIEWEGMKFDETTYGCCFAILPARIAKHNDSEQDIPFFSNEIFMAMSHITALENRRLRWS